MYGAACDIVRICEPFPGRLIGGRWSLGYWQNINFYFIFASWQISLDHCIRFTSLDDPSPREGYFNLSRIHFQPSLSQNLLTSSRFLPRAGWFQNCAYLLTYFQRPRSRAYWPIFNVAQDVRYDPAISAALRSSFDAVS
jgi:hypothetical protein